MAKRNGNGKDKETAGRPRKEASRSNGRSEPQLHPDTMRSIWAILLLGGALILSLAGFALAGPAGEAIFEGFEYLLGWGYFILPLTLLTLGVLLLGSARQKFVLLTLGGLALFLLASLGLIDLWADGKGGVLGLVLGSLKYPFGIPAAAILNLVFLVVATLLVLNTPLRLNWRWNADEEDEEEPGPVITGVESVRPETTKTESKKPEEVEPEEVEPVVAEKDFSPKKKAVILKFKDYVPPPLDLLKSSTEKPTTGDLRANANIIKRTLESFGIPVDMGEINIGPKVTRYTLKPAEGVKLSRLTALNPDLALALAAHPIRIEAPIPGKSFVGIEVPNKAAAVVRLGSLMAYPDFHAAPLGFTLGRDVTGEPIFGNIEKMPHLLIAGATGSGKSVMIHSLLMSLLYKNSPTTLKLVLIDPKRVELTAYENMPHLVSPVITEAKKTVGVFRWAIGEMDRRYELLQHAGSRDIRSYNSGGGKDEPLPYIVIVVDELADIMTSYGREVEGSIVRLAQMARATGIHLVLATQRPSVEVITGLIKANITSRIALQVASQIDSRTILDNAGAEKLLGGGDMLFMAAELSKPKRIQGAYVSEEEIHAVTDFIRENNQAVVVEAPAGEDAEGTKGPADIFADSGGDGDDDEMYDEALRIVAAAQKASASLLQRRLKVGYARAARLLDIMEERGVIGPGEGAKPREVFVDKILPEDVL